MGHSTMNWLDGHIQRNSQPLNVWTQIVMSGPPWRLYGNQ